MLARSVQCKSRVFPGWFREWELWTILHCYASVMNSVKLTLKWTGSICCYMTPKTKVRAVLVQKITIQVTVSAFDPLVSNGETTTHDGNARILFSSSCLCVYKVFWLILGAHWATVCCWSSSTHYCRRVDHEIEHAAVVVAPRQPR